MSSVLRQTVPFFGALRRSQPTPCPRAVRRDWCSVSRWSRMQICAQSWKPTHTALLKTSVAVCKLMPIQNHRCPWLYCIVPRCSVTFLDPPGNHPRGAIFPTVDYINQSSVDFHCKPFGWLIDWLTMKLTLTWLVYWIRTTRSVFTGAGLKWLNTAGQYSTATVKIHRRPYPCAQ